MVVSNLQLAVYQIVVNKEVTIVSYDDNDKYRFSEGLCAIQRNQLWGFMDTTGKIVIDFRFRNNGFEIPAFHEGKCCVCMKTEQEDSRRLYIDKTGRALFQNQGFSGITAFSDGLAIVEKSDPSKPPF